jgi:hypothetical protein
MSQFINQTVYPVGRYIFGYTRKDDPENNYTGRDLNESPYREKFASGLGGRIGNIAATQIHELAHALGQIYRSDLEAFRDPTKDGDAGDQFEQCVVDKLKGK